jgi:predicted nucleic acid-binding protein
MIVSDSTTLIILFDLNRLELLENIFPKVYIPQKVYDEISFKKDLVIPDFMTVVQVQETTQLEELKMLLDDGESEAIALAIEKKLPLIIDEKKGRKIAQNLNIKIIGLLGVVYLNIKKEFISINEAKEFLTIAKDNGYRISNRLIDDMFNSL